jgi:hypothetical protein
MRKQVRHVERLNDSDLEDSSGGILAAFQREELTEGSTLNKIMKGGK